MDIKNSGATLALIFNEIKGGTLPKTFLIEGKDESARTSAAKLCAAALMCENAEPPCGKCPSCIKTLAGTHPDVAEISPLKEKITVDYIRSVRASAYVSPFESENKVIIFHKADELNVQSQNALLKILEEPPEKVRFILTCPTSGSLLPTVASRCARFSLGAVSRGDVLRSISELLKETEKNKLNGLCTAALYLDGFVPNETNVRNLELAAEISNDFYADGFFPFEKYSLKKEDSDTLKLIFKVLALCALEIMKHKKGIKLSNCILKNEILNSASAVTTAKDAFEYYEFFCDLLQRTEANANISAISAALQSGV